MVSKKVIKHSERKKKEFVTYNVIKTLSSTEGPTRHNDLISRLLVNDGYHNFFKSPEEYQNYIMMTISKLHNNMYISIKIGDDGPRYGVLPKDRPYKRREEMR